MKTMSIINNYLEMFVIF